MRDFSSASHHSDDPIGKDGNVGATAGRRMGLAAVSVFAACLAGGLLAIVAFRGLSPAPPPAVSVIQLAPTTTLPGTLPGPTTTTSSTKTTSLPPPQRPVLTMPPATSLSATMPVVSAPLPTGAPAPPRTTGPDDDDDDHEDDDDDDVDDGDDDD